MPAKKLQQREPDCPTSANEWCIDDVIDEELENEESIFVNLSENRESFTAYEGASIWQAIYAENCHCDDGIKNLQQESEETCSERTLLYQLMSGLHTSINTHIADGFEDPLTGETIHNLTYFKQRVGDHEERLKNLHLIYAVAVRAVSRL
jgi:hypothetical protein